MNWLEKHVYVANWISAIVAIIAVLLSAAKIVGAARMPSFAWLTEKRLMLAFLLPAFIFEVFATSFPFVAVGMRIVAGIGAVLMLFIILLLSLPDN